MVRSVAHCICDPTIGGLNMMNEGFCNLLDGCCVHLSYASNGLAYILNAINSINYIMVGYPEEITSRGSPLYALE